jgi:hypothetical protein
MRVDAIPTPLRVAGAAAAVLVISLFLPWYGTSVEALGVDASVTAWEAFALIDVLLLLLGGASVLVVAMVGRGRERDLPLPASTLLAALGGVAAILVIYRFLDLPLDGVDRRYGLFLGLAAAIGVAVSGWIAMRERGETFDDARSRIGDRVSDARSQAAGAIEGDPSASRRYEDRSREELYEEAQRRGIEGRSDMDKEELAEALRRRG